LYISEDQGLTWSNPAGDITGIHPGVTQLDDGSLLGYGRGGQIDGRMIESRSYDRGNSFQYSASEFNPIGGGQRLVLLKLRQGPLFFASFANQNGISTVPAVITDSEGNKHEAHELFAAVSFDGGKTWPHKRVVTDDKGPHPVECTDGGVITLNSLSSEHRGYMSVCQSLDGVIHLITSRQHYAFNLKWLTTPPPPPAEKLKVTTETEAFDGSDFDLDGWANYKGYTGGFNNKGQYTINSIMPYGGLNKTVGTGSFDATFAMENLSFHPGLRGGEMSVGFKDKFCRTWFLIIKPDHINIYFKDVVAGENVKRPKPEPVKYENLPKSLKARFTFDETTGRCQVYYGFNGEEAIHEMPQSKAGLYMAEPFSESNAAYILITEAIAEMDQFSIKPLNQ
jgi:hypothetical protein